MSAACRDKSRYVLTGEGESVNFEFPNYTSRNRRLSRSPHGEKVLSAHSAIFHVPAGIVSSGRYVSIGRPATSSIREDWRLRIGRGALCGLPLFLTLELYEVSYVQV